MAKKVVDSFATDSFFRLMTAKQNQTELLECFLHALRATLNDDAVQAALTTLAEKAQKSVQVQTLANTYELILSMCDGLLALLVPLPELYNLSAKDLATLVDPSTKYGFPFLDSMKSTVQMIMAESTFWQEAINQTQRTAATSKEFGPKIVKYQESLEEYVEGNADINAAARAILTTLQDYKMFKENLKSGAMDELKEQLSNALKKFTSFITSAPQAAATSGEVPVDLILPVVQHASVFASEEDDSFVAECQQRLEVWFSQIESDVVAMNIQKTLNQAAEEISQSLSLTCDGRGSILIDWTLLLGNFQK